MKEIVLLIHGTWGAYAEDEGPAWWQRNSPTWHALRKRLPSGVSLLEAGELFRWSGENTIEARRRAAIRLLHQMRRLELQGQPYHLVAHSHGGSVVWMALVLSVQQAGEYVEPAVPELKLLKSWTTVGTPFLGEQPDGSTAWLYLTMAIYCLSALLLYVYIRSYIGPGGGLLSITDVLWNVFRVIIQIVPIAFILLVLLAPFITRGLERQEIRKEGQLEGRALRFYGPKFLGLWSAEDEAIAGLQASLHVSGEIVPRRQAPASYHEVTRLRRDLRQGAALKSERFPVFSNSRAVWLFELIFGWVLRIPYNSLFAPRADRFIWRQLSKAVQGNNRPATRIAWVGRYPAGLPSPPNGLPPNINEAICNLANESAREAVPRIRKSLGEIQFGPGITPNQDSLRLSISGHELVHTSYFRCGELLDLICTHIRLTTGVPGGLHSEPTPEPWDEWVQEHKMRWAELYSAKCSDV